MRPGRGRNGARRARQPPAALGSPSEPRALPALCSAPRATLSGGSSSCEQGCSFRVSSSEAGQAEARGSQGLPGDDPRSRGTRRTRATWRPELWLRGYQGLWAGFRLCLLKPRARVSFSCSPEASTCSLRLSLCRPFFVPQGETRTGSLSIAPRAGDLRTVGPGGHRSLWFWRDHLFSIPLSPCLIGC